MAEPVEDLIHRLAADARPVRRLRPPLLRAGLWLVGVAALCAVAIFGFADLQVFAERAANPRLVWELAGTVLTGVAAVIAAFHLSLPDRPHAWALLPAPPLALWIGSSGYSCYRHWIDIGPGGWELGDSADCFRFILGASIPLGIALYLALRRALPLTPLPVALVGGLGTAGIAAFVLQFFHPFDVTFMDLAVHFGTVGLVVGGAAFCTRLSVGLNRG